MIEISINKICKSYGFKDILNNVSFDIKSGEIIGIIGDNGSGKTTLLNIINKDEMPDTGIVSIRKNSTIGYLKQTLKQTNDNIMVKDFLLTSLSAFSVLENKLRDYENKMANCDELDLDKLLNKYGALQEKYQNMGGYEISRKIDKIVKGFKIDNLLNKKVNTLSGGEARIVDLARIMIKNPNILLLDEPTNHLDIKTLEWFENYLKKYNGTVLIISHDRYFLDRVATKTILIEKSKTFLFNGNYSYYLKENENRLLKAFKDYKDQQKLIAALKKKIKQLEEFGKLAYPHGEPFFRRAENIRKRLERIELKEKPLEKKDIPINFNFNLRSGNDVLILDDYDLKINDNILINNINIRIKYKDKICIMGDNGTGKSTLLKAILNNQNIKIKIGSNVKIGYVPQEIKFDESISVLEYAKSIYIGDESHLRSALSKFYFCGENVFKRINKLSGGEKVRLKLFELIQKKDNFLILDEPTNHIDISTKEILEEALRNFDGTILFVSHDRYFINSLANKILYINDNRIDEYIGDYDALKHRLNN